MIRKTFKNFQKVLPVSRKTCLKFLIQFNFQRKTRSSNVRYMENNFFLYKRHTILVSTSKKTIFGYFFQRLFANKDFNKKLDTID